MVKHRQATSEVRTARLDHVQKEDLHSDLHHEARPSQPMVTAILCCSMVGAVALLVNTAQMQEEWELNMNSTTQTTTTMTTTTWTATRSTTVWQDQGFEVAQTARREGRVFGLSECTEEDNDTRCEPPFMGINIAGWLVMEDGLLPAEMKDEGINDEWSFIKQLGGPSSPRAVKAMREHWESFITDKDLDELVSFGFTHVRVPVGYWLVDYDESDGFVPRGQLYLFRFLAWLKQRQMKAVIVLQALPGGQAADTSSTGRRNGEADFFLDQDLYRRGQRVMHKLAEWIVQTHENPLTSGTVVGFQPLNEPDWQYWPRSPGIRELYETVVPGIRELLPADKCALLLDFGEPILFEGLDWLADMRRDNTDMFTGIFYDVHMPHSASSGNEWDTSVDSCETCCREPVFLKPLEIANVPAVIGRYSLNTGSLEGADLWAAIVASFQNKLSLWANIPGVVGSFVWNHRVGSVSTSSAENRSSDQRPDHVRPKSMLDVISPDSPLLDWWAGGYTDHVLNGLCPDEDLSRCPAFTAGTVQLTDQCSWW